MEKLGFENYAGALKIYLTKYQEVSYFLFFSYLPTLSSPPEERVSNGQVLRAEDVNNL